ncbi:MAG TPA: VOC family protein [Dehalococcoidia bacterium]|nr:VOC family protein [Dehalococcoidia bacterium]
MEVQRIRWAGVRTHDFASTVRFFSEVMGLSPNQTDTTRMAAGFRLPSGQQFEVFGPASRYFPLHGCPVLGFEVDDVHAARRELEAAGVEFVSEVIEEPSGEAWTYFRGPDGVLYELTQPERGWPPWRTGT